MTSLKNPFAYLVILNFMSGARVSRDPLVIFGAGGHAVSIACAALDAGFEIHSFVSPTDSPSELLGLPVNHPSEFNWNLSHFQLAVAIGDNNTRKRVSLGLRSNHPHLVFATIVHPSASIGHKSEIGPGTVILQNATLGALANVGYGCILNTGSILEHQSLMGNYSSLAPGVTVGGNCSIGSETAISIGATVKHGIQIGEQTVIGGQSYVNINVPELCVAYGVPAKQIRARKPDSIYL